MKNLSKIVLGVCSIATGSLFAENNCSAWNPYVEVKGMTAKAEEHLTVKSKWGYGGAFEAGLSYEDWRIGFEVAYFKTKGKSISGIPLRNGAFLKVNNLSGMVNVYRDFTINDSFDVYAGAGIGLSRTKFKCDIALIITDVVGLIGEQGAKYFMGERGAKHDTHFTWQVMGGVTYRITENWSTKLGYRFFKVQSKDCPDVHMLELGLRYNF